MSHDIFKPSNLIGCLENKTADSAQTRKRAIATDPFPPLEGGVWARDYWVDAAHAQSFLRTDQSSTEYSIVNEELHAINE